ncbi:unnamed protein product [Litomosoides sigmodontis]|uniref:Uncharacterized protein n=1 Tax=Litomosoides sigmodontis TaxID=42156 RepID=A0A3P7JWR1_LITSI|nr:unnamed protein product [Litomosoides sigmodontis]
MTSDDWYNKQLSLNDVIAGGTLTLLAIVFLSINVVTSFVLYHKSNVTTGFRYLLSASINNIFLLMNYALFPGMLILLKKHTPVRGRRLFQSIVLYFQPWYVTFYYEASAYGMVAEDISSYLEGGKSKFFIVFHSLIFIPTFSLYGCALVLLFKYSRQVQKSVTRRVLSSNAVRPSAIRNWSIFATTNISMRSETRFNCFA